MSVRTICVVLFFLSGVSTWWAPQLCFAQQGGSQYSPPVRLASGEKSSPKKLPPTAVPPSIDSLLRLAHQEEQAKHPWAAINAFRKALEQDPRNKTVLISYARLKHRAGDVEGAKILYRQVLQYYPNDATALNDLALCHARRKEYEEAIQLLRTAVESSPKNKRYRNNLATIMIESGEVQPAFDMLAQTFGAPIAHYNVGWLLHRQGKTAEAISHLQQALQLDPSLTPASQLLEQTQRQLNTTSPSSLAVHEGPAGALWNPSKEPMFRIAPQSGEEIVGTASPVDAAVYHEVLDAGAEPPNVDDYPVPGLNEFLESEAELEKN